MKSFKLTLTQINGQITLILFRDEKDKRPLVASMSVAPSQWEEARWHLLAHVMERLVEQIKKESKSTSQA